MTTTTPHDAKEAEHSGATPLPGEAAPGRDDGVLDSIGKAISSPIAGAAEADEPNAATKKPPQPPG